MRPYTQGRSRVEVPGHLIAPAGGHHGALHLASQAPSPNNSSGTAGGPGGVAGTPPAQGGGGVDDHHTLTNGIIAIGVKNLGAELTSLKSARTGLEYLWQGDPAFWGKQAPVLFPIVGRLNNDTYTYQGITYHMTQHGLARTMRFELSDTTPTSISFKLRYTEDTLKQYPFKFKLVIRYALDNDTLRVGYDVRNLDASPMLFSIGAHPGFKCPLMAGEKYEDYCLMWDGPTTLNRHFLENGIIPPQTEPFLRGQCELTLSRSMFDRDAIVLKNVDFSRMHVLNKATGHGVTIDMAGFPYFGIWAKPGADFVCIEPWHGIGDNAGAGPRLEDKEGIIELQGRDSFLGSYTITLR